MNRDERKKRAEARNRLEQAKTQMYQDLVLECAERLFAERGFEQVTMRDIAGSAGISPKTLYAVFPGKDDIYAAVSRGRSLALLDLLREAADKEAPALDRLKRSIRVLVAFLVEHRAFFGIMMRESRSWGLLPSGDGSGGWRAGHRLQADLIQQGIDEGVFYEGDPELMAAVAISIVQVLLAAALERPGKPDPFAIADEIFLQLQRSFRVLPPYVLEGTKAG